MSVAATKPQIVNQNISYEVIGHYTKNDLTAIVAPFYKVFNTSGNVSATMPQEFAPQTGVTLYKVNYNVFVTALNRVEQATGLIAIPDSVDKASTPIVSWQHGTIFSPEGGPSHAIITVPDGEGIKISDNRTVSSSSAETLFNIALFAANRNFVVTAADYLGDGDSPVEQSYLVKQPTVETMVSQLSATDVILSALNIRSDRLFVDGWSQGGLNSQWLTQKLQTLNVPVSGGAFFAPPTDPLALFSDQATVVRTSITTPPGWALPISGLVLQAYEYYLNLSGLMNTAIRPEYQNLMKSILSDPGLVDWIKTNNETLYFNKDFRTDSGALVRSMKAPLSSDVLIPGLTQKYTFPVVSDFLKYMDASKPYNWTYNVPVRMYYGTQDEIITLGTTEQRLAFLQPSVTPIKITDADHRGTFLYGLFGTGTRDGVPVSSAAWFSKIDQAPVSAAHLTLQNDKLAVSGGAYTTLGVQVSALSTAVSSTQAIEIRSIAADETYDVIGSLGQSSAAGVIGSVFGTTRIALQPGEHLGFAYVDSQGARTVLDTKIIATDQGYVVNLLQKNGTPIGLTLAATESDSPYRLADKIAGVQGSASASFLNLNRGDSLTFKIASTDSSGTIGLVKLDQAEKSGLPIAAVAGLTPDQAAFADVVKARLVTITHQQNDSAYWVAPNDGVFAVVKLTSDGKILTFGERLAADGQSHIRVLGDNVFGFETGIGAANDHDFNDVVVRVEPVVNMNQFVNALYRVDFGRAPDRAGFEGWVGQAVAQKWTPGNLVEKFAASSEYSADFPAAMRNDQFIAKLYQNAFNRVAGPQEQAVWVTALNHGMSRNDVVLSFATSDEMIGLVGSMPSALTA